MASTILSCTLVVFVMLASSFVGYGSANPTFPFTYMEQGTNVIMTLRTKSAADQWLAVGFNANGKMYPSDAIVCEKGTNTRCTDRRCTGPTECVIDPMQNISTVVTTAEGITTFVVTRPMRTTDPDDQVITAGTAPRMIWAWAAGPTSTVHTEKGSFTPSLTGGTGTTNNAWSAVMQLKGLSALVVVAVSTLAFFL